MVSRLPPPMVADKVEILNIEEYHQDPTMLTAVLHEEDHTIGNALKHIICQMPGVEFCGYNIPHPLEDKILVRIQTKKGVAAGDCLCQGLTDLMQIFGEIQRKFTAAHEEFVGIGTRPSAAVTDHSRDEYMEETTTDDDNQQQEGTSAKRKQKPKK